MNGLFKFSIWDLPSAPHVHQKTGTSHKELRESLEEERGEVVMAGEYPPWPDDSDGIVTAYVPDSDGIVRPGAY